MERLGLSGFPVALRALRLVEDERRMIAVVIALSLSAAFLEGLGLSMLVPLLSILADGGDGVWGGPLGYLDRFVGLDASSIVLLAAAFFVGGIAVGYLNEIVAARLGMRIVHNVRTRLFRELLRRPVSVLEGEPQGKFVNILATESWRLSDALFITVGILVNAVAIVVFTTLLLLLSPFYSLVLAAMVTVVGALIYVATRSARRLGTVALGANEEFTSHLWDVLGGVRIVRAHALEEWEGSRFAALSDQVRSAFTRLAALSALVPPLSRVSAALIVSILVLIALAQGNDLAVLGGYLAIAYRTQPRVTGILQSEVRLRGLDASVSAIEGALQRDPEPVAPGVLPFREVRTGIVFESVSARYPGSKTPALEGIRCTFSPGRVTAVAGSSGAGKSTLAALLLRFLVPESGRILVDGRPLSAIAPGDWHRRIGFVEQDCFLFRTSIRENIAYGMDADFQSIRRAARLAQADEFIADLEHGYATVLSDHGRGLSQGQRQRIALARALLRDPRVLILDEATNALDTVTERAVRLALHPAPSDRVVIVIAHRPETVAEADDVIVLDRGRVVAAGTPADLLGRSDEYVRLFGKPPIPLRAVT